MRIEEVTDEQKKWAITEHNKHDRPVIDIEREFNRRYGVYTASLDHWFHKWGVPRRDKETVHRILAMRKAKRNGTTFRRNYAI